MGAVCPSSARRRPAQTPSTTPPWAVGPAQRWPWDAGVSGVGSGAGGDGCAPLMVLLCRREQGDVEQHQETLSQGHPALVPHPGWGQPGGDSPLPGGRPAQPLPGHPAVGTQEAGDEGRVAGCQKEEGEEVVVLRGHRPQGRCRHRVAVPPAAAPCPEGAGQAGGATTSSLCHPQTHTQLSAPCACAPCAQPGSSPHRCVHGPCSVPQLVAPPGSQMLQSLSKPTVPVGTRAAGTQGPPKTLPRARPPQNQQPGEPPPPPAPTTQPPPSARGQHHGFGAAPGLQLKHHPSPRCWGPVPARPHQHKEGPAPAARLRRGERHRGLRQGCTELPVLSQAAGPEPRQGAESCQHQPLAQPLLGPATPLSPCQTSTEAGPRAPWGHAVVPTRHGRQPAARRCCGPAEEDMRLGFGPVGWH